MTGEGQLVPYFHSMQKMEKCVHVFLIGWSYQFADAHSARSKKGGQIVTYPSWYASRSQQGVGIGLIPTPAGRLLI